MKLWLLLSETDVFFSSKSVIGQGGDSGNCGLNGAGRSDLACQPGWGALGTLRCSPERALTALLPASAQWPWPCTRKVVEGEGGLELFKFPRALRSHS